MKNPQAAIIGSFVSGIFANTTTALAALLFLAAAPMQVRAKDNRAPDVPEAIAVPEGNKVHFRAFAVGVQIYAWNGTAWVFRRRKPFCSMQAMSWGSITDRLRE
jgi:hypothetical protein